MGLRGSGLGHHRTSLQRFADEVVLFRPGPPARSGVVAAECEVAGM